MSPEESLIRSVEAAPADDLPRLVYADWCDENGREPFADFLRTELELAKLPPDSPAAPPLRERLWQAWAAVDAAWLHRFTQPKLLRANPTPFPAGWLHFNLRDLRPLDRRTAECWAYDTLPPLPADEFLGTFGYLGELQPLPNEPGEHFPSGWGMAEAPRHLAQVARVRIEAEKLGIHLPSDFLNFMGNFPLCEQIRSAEENYFHTAIGDEQSRLRFGDNGTPVMCYAQIHHAVRWDVIVHRSGAHCVVARSADGLAIDYPTARPRSWFVAPSFAAFVYRIWVECRIWWDYLHAEARAGRGEGVVSITPAIQAYIDHYRTPANGTT